MFTNIYRPNKFSDVIGQESAVSILKSMALDIDRAPRVALLEGAFGTGKCVVKETLIKVRVITLNLTEKQKSFIYNIPDASAHGITCEVTIPISQLEVFSDYMTIGDGVKFTTEHRINGVEVLTPDGYRFIQRYYTTIPFMQYEIITESGKSLICADTHLLQAQVSGSAALVNAKDLDTGDSVYTIDGLERITDIHISQQKVPMCDISIMSLDKLYYTNGFVSHNTTLARIFAKAIFCSSFKKEKDVCLRCAPCGEFGTTNQNYMEYDSSVMGSKSSIDDMKYIIDASSNGKRILVFDESHLITKTAQSALLKYIEEGPKDTFFMFVTTEADKMLKTIVSRSVPINFQTVDLELIQKRLRYIVDTENYDVPDDVLYKIALKSGGHVRNALMTLDVYVLSMDNSVINIPLDDFKQYFKYIQIDAFDQAMKTVDVIMKYPLHEIKKSLLFCVSKIVESFVSNKDNGYKDIAKDYGTNSFKLLRLVSDPWVQESLKDDSLTYSLLISLTRLARFK